MRNWDKKPVIISSKRLLLVLLELSDAEVALEWVNNEEIVRNFQFFTGAISIEEEMRYIENMRDSSTDLLFGIIEAGELIGTCGLHEIDFKNDTARLGVIIGKKEHWNKGYAREAICALLDFAFSAAGLHKIYLNVFVANEKSVHLYAEIGFQNEGTLKSEYKIRGEYVDMFRMSVLKDGWQKGAG